MDNGFLLVFLIVFPFLAAIALLLLPQFTIRKFIVQFSALVLIVASIYLLFKNLQAGDLYFPFESPLISQGMLLIEGLLALIVIWLSIRYKNLFTALLMLVQVGIIVYFELSYGHLFKPTYNLFMDQFSIIMALIIGIIGSLICVYAVGYMKDYHHHHPEVRDRTPYFFFLMFVFLAAMFGLVFANNLLWLYFFWEITTLCSFLLIGYSRTEVAVKNAFRALAMNLLGGLAFAVGIVYLFLHTNVLELNKLLGLNQAVVILPVVCLSLAGITKSAQLPFSSWLLGAMVAPTPTSALLHSSTMVKAGVYLIIRLSPVLAGTTAGLLVALVGAITFLLASFIAVSQAEAKRVLAYSTVANLGLIVTCAGVGTPELVWAAIMLVIFHAVAKALLFLAVGTVEHKLGDRNIEIMDGLVNKLPEVAVVMVIGMAGMFLAPFGMLISKWAALKGLVQANPLLTVFLAFGSAATLFFWTKWMGKLLMFKQKPAGPAGKVEALEKNPLYTLAALTIGVCLLFPLLSSALLEPYIQLIYHESFLLRPGNTIILLIMMGLVIFLPLSILLFYKDRELNYVEVYLAGVNESEEGKFTGAMGIPRQVSLKSFYLEKYFGEGKLANLGIVVSTIVILVMFGVGML